MIGNDYLEHHGILGQKWGRRNGPPYPIEEGQHSAAEKKENPGIDKETPKKRSYKDLSNQELREQTERLRLENEFLRQSYDAMKLAQGPQIQQGKNWLQKTADVSKTLATVAISANNISKSLTGKDISKFLSDLNSSKQKATSFDADKWLTKNIETNEERAKYISDWIKKQKK